MTAMTRTEAFRRPRFASHTCRLRLIPGPGGLAASACPGDAGVLNQHGRRLIYSRVGRGVCWYEFIDDQQMELPFPEPAVTETENR